MYMGAREMAWWVRHLLYHCEDLSLNLYNPGKASCRGMPFQSQHSYSEIRGRGRRMPWSMRGS